jgi:cysteine synthase A
MSSERKQMMRIYGAEIIEVDDSDFQGAIAMRNEMISDDVWSPCQFENQINIECHQFTTAHEIHSDLRVRGVWSKNWDAFVCGSGTGGTMMGVRGRNKRVSECKHVKHVLMVPAEDSACHGIQGINDGADFLLNRSLMDDIIEVSTDNAIKRTKRLAREKGLLVGISSGANVCAAEEWIRRNPSSTGSIVTILCDRGERYMSLF